MSKEKEQHLRAQAMAFALQLSPETAFHNQGGTINTRFTNANELIIQSQEIADWLLDETYTETLSN